jgi:hypothetical protein
MQIHCTEEFTVRELFTGVFNGAIKGGPLARTKTVEFEVEGVTLDPHMDAILRAAVRGVSVIRASWLDFASRFSYGGGNSQTRCIPYETSIAALQKLFRFSDCLEEQVVLTIEAEIAGPDRLIITRAGTKLEDSDTLGLIGAPFAVTDMTIEILPPTFAFVFGAEISEFQFTTTTPLLLTERAVSQVFGAPVRFRTHFTDYYLEGQPLPVVRDIARHRECIHCVGADWVY